MTRTFTQPKASRLDQDATLDQISTGVMIDKNPRRIPLSLAPDERVMVGCVENNRYAVAVRDSWKAVHYVTIMSPLAFDELSERCSTTFHGLDKDIDDTASIKQAQEQEVDCA